ncbi:MAG TPA: EFR1 family ferrodoxin, partial [bacterium]|nr:EFR1 family ferrodoxin [bacterium]
MKNLIYYFSGTGNSFVIARQISEHLQNCSLLSIAKELKNSEKIKISKDIERIGIVFPVYAWGMPLILHRFIDAIEFDGNPYIFAVMNYGGFGAGTLLQLTKKLKNKGRQLSAGFGIKMPGNYLPLYGAKPIETQNKLFEQSKKQIDEIVKIINSKSVHKIEKNFFIVNFLFTDIIYNAGIKKISQAAKEFWTNEKCVNCQLCIKICPVNN